MTFDLFRNVRTKNIVDGFVSPTAFFFSLFFLSFITANLQRRSVYLTSTDFSDQRINEAVLNTSIISDNIILFQICDIESCSSRFDNVTAATQTADRVFE